MPPARIHQLHDKVRLAIRSGPSIENPGNVRVIHEGQGLAFRLKSRHDFFRFFARSDHLHSDSSSHWLDLLGHVDNAEPPFADLLQKFVATDFLATEVLDFSEVNRRMIDTGRRLLKKLPITFMGGDKCRDAIEEGGIGRTNLAQISFPSLCLRDLDRYRENGVIIES